MKEKQFLFRLGLILVPALFTVPSPSGGLLVAAAVLAALALLEGARFLTRFLPAGFWQDLAEILVIAALLGLADWGARTYFLSLWAPMGVYFQLVLLNAALALRREPVPVKWKTFLWFAFSLLGFALLRRADPSGFTRNSFTVFFGAGMFLYGLGICFRRRWCVL